MGDLITVSDLEVRDGVARVEDARLAEALGFVQKQMIRPLIKRHIEALQRFGEVYFIRNKPGPKGGRPSQVFYLNEEQAIYITAKSDTPKAAEITVEMVRVFRAYLNGEEKPVRVRQHRRGLPAPSVSHSVDRIEVLEAQVKMLMESAVTLRELYGIAMSANLRMERCEERGFGEALEHVAGDLVTRAAGGMASGRALVLLHKDHEHKRGAIPEMRRRPEH